MKELQKLHQEHLDRTKNDEAEPFKVRVVVFDNKLLGQKHMGLNSRDYQIIRKEAVLEINKCDDLNALRLSFDGNSLHIAGIFRFKKLAAIGGYTSKHAVQNISVLEKMMDE